jgi:capsular exopolysaccharide synthesis family protein
MDNLSRVGRGSPFAPTPETLPANRPRNAVNPYGFEKFDDDDADGGMIEYWRILKRNQLTIIAASMVGLTLGFAIGIPMKPVYRVKTSLEVLSINEDFMNMKHANPNTTEDNNYDTSEEQTQAKLLASSALLERVISKLDPNAAARPTVATMAQSGWRSLLHLSNPIKLTPLEKLLNQAADSIKIRPTAKTRVLEITVDCNDRQVATDFANTLTSEFISLNMEARWSTTQQTSEWLRRELDDARSKLRKSEDALQNYASNSGLIFTDETTNVATEKLQQLQQNLSSATADRIAKQSRLELAQNAPAQSLGDVLSDVTLRETESKINDLKRQIADLSTVYNPEYSKLRRLQAELEATESAFSGQRSDILARIKNDFTESKRKEELLALAYNSQAHEVTGQDEKAIQYNILKRDVDSNRQLYDAMLQQMKQASIASAMRASNVRIVDPAQPPNSPAFPNFKLNSALGMICGLILSIAAVTIRERADRTLQQPGDIKLWAEMTEVGVIPAASAVAASARYYEPSKRLSDEAKLLPTKVPQSPVKWNSQSMIAEAFRSTLTSVLFMADTGDMPKVVVFTSANAADGKTTVASNLAIAAAEIRMKVLIVDADLRRPRMHSIFDISNERGLIDILRGEANEASLPDLIQRTQISNLFVLPAGAPTHSASHLLYSPAWAEMLNALRKEYDMIFVDTPPMLQMTDARVAARAADAVILVGRSNHTTRDALIAAKERLAEDRIRVLGAVLNDWNPKSSPGGYYGSYRYNYYNRPYNGTRRSKASTA